MNDKNNKRVHLAIRQEVAARLKKLCSENGLKLQFAAEQAVAEWIQKQTRERITK